MEDLDPIKQLQSLLDDRGKVLEKISGIHSALNSIKSTTSSPPALDALSKAAAAVESKPYPTGEDRLYSRLLQALHDMQSQIEERVRPLAQLTVQEELTNLRAQSEKDRAGLQECVARIDQCMLICVDRFNEYQRGYAELTTLNQRIVALGATSETLPENLVAQNLSDTINQRLQNLRLTGKI